METKKNDNPDKVRIGVLVSGGGTNLQAIIDSCESGILKDIAEIAAVISNKADAYALERAKKHGIYSKFIDRKNFQGNAAFCQEIAKELKSRGVKLICLAGYLCMITPELIKEFKGNIINIHPALLPKFGGKGMYGHNVHETVLKSGDKESGATVHWVNEIYDNGEIIIQKRVSVIPNDTPESLAKRILPVEHQIYPEAILKIIKEGLKIKG
ncbi:MAG: phosphoribosylglycinamide formyltransferase [Elusimicrobia bacterium]|nr:phosphoribosylglycinamide formyltransferase [Elusimicrobiota bacterium]